jgi:hypothetical protein
MVSSNRKTTISVELQRFDVESQERFDWLLDQNNKRRLTLAEREELQGLVAQYENLLLQNSPPYTSFLLNGDIELNRNRQLFVENIL